MKYRLPGSSAAGTASTKTITVNYSPTLSAAETALVQATAANQDISDVRRVGSQGWLRLHSRSRSTRALLDHLKSSPNVEYVEPNYIGHLFAVPTPTPQYWNYQWGIRATGAPDAWNTTTGSSNVVVGVIDSGVDYYHPDLKDNVWSAPSGFSFQLSCCTQPGCPPNSDHPVRITCPAGTRGVNLCGLCPSDPQGFQNYCPTPVNVCDPMDNDLWNNGRSHGTQMSGIIAAEGKGVIGMAPQVEILPIRIADTNGQFTDTDAANALEFAEQIGTLVISGPPQPNKFLRILNMSWGHNETSLMLQDELVAAHYVLNALLVAAAGNGFPYPFGQGGDIGTNPMSPAGLQGVMAVAALDNAGHLTSYSNYGASSTPGAATVQLAAPGGVCCDWNAEVLSTVRSQGGDSYASDFGTSMSAAFVSGAAALVFSKCPPLRGAVLNADDVWNIIADNTVVPPDPSLIGKTINGQLLIATTGQMIPCQPAYASLAVTDPNHNPVQGPNYKVGALSSSR